MPRFEQINAEIEARKEAATQLSAQRATGLSAHKEAEARISTLKTSLDSLQTEYDAKMKEDTEKVAGKFLNTVSVCL